MAGLPFSFSQTQKPSEIYVEIGGDVTDKSTFPKAPPACPLIRISLKTVTGFNSIGTRNWMTWLRQLPAASSIVIENAPVLFVKAFNQIKGTLTSNTTVNSFMVPFSSEATGQRFDFLLVRGHHFDGSDGVVKNLPELTDSEGNRMEMDILPQNYFGFLKKK